MRTLVALLAAALLLGACGGSKPSLDKLERDTGLQVVNSGVPGEISADGLARLPEALEEAQPKLLILCHGGNDFLRKMDDATAAANIRAMIQLARSRGAPVVLLGTPKPGLPPSVPKFYGDIAREMRVPYEDAVLRDVLLDNASKSDMVHPNGKGYARIAAAIEKLLKKAGAI